jgi:pimeloyl-ACP methyl ester carboxylesterase
MQGRFIQTTAVQLYTESFGNASDTPILLIMGAMASGVWWPEEFCRQLAGRGRYVIRYDHRDTGRSTSYEPGRCAYTLEDLSGDAISILDAYQIRRAHLAGMSLGGMIAQLLALKVPDRVFSLTLIASGPLAETDPAMPSIDPRVLAHHARAGDVDWSDREAVADYQVGGWRLLSGPGHAFDEAAIRELSNADFDRTPNLLTAMNHAFLGGGERWFGRLEEIQAATLVIHGTEDPVLPYAHGVALGKAVPLGTLLTLKGTGHELHRDDWPTMLDAIERHTQIEDSDR